MTGRLRAHIATALKIIDNYDGTVPFAGELKKYFSLNKKHGSKDRKAISALCYAYFRLGRSIPNDTDRELRMKIAMLLSEQPLQFIDMFEEGEKAIAVQDLSDRISYVQQTYPAFNVNDIFPWSGHLSEQIEHDAFTISHLIQPDVFLRIRPNRKDIVENGLKRNEIRYAVDKDVVRLDPSIKIDTALQIDRDAVVQDKSSQRVIGLLNGMKFDQKISVWDCCAASGGKSLLMLDHFKEQDKPVKVELTVSDIRETIIHNLKKRFAEAGVSNYRSFVADLSRSHDLPVNGSFDLVICDAPCSGSGTWGRTPEQLLFFKEEKIGHYTSLQKSIVTNAARFVKGGGYLLYITCSVFREENEDVVNHIQNELKLELLKMEYFKGYDEKADTLFAAIFTASKG